ncbi:hypothetical protein WM40_25015 [Robbsia andropogonis]|uniref:Uncharacterized protein n=1 Tax=Robbsia andropogonis TaxID=28092 RepID=A0A0F5JV04_9BURK|nr:hypothetical protein [Robbsia andropogonis]KKB61132.1 hypothetical protein WM40_25015 [Robbsia andropogonis]
MKDFGFEEGDVCGRDRCAGRIETRSAENCSCHLSAPCGACTAPRNFCPECDWDEVDEPVEPMPKAAAQPYVWPELRPLDPTRINWRNYAHSSFSMIKEGVYPEGTTLEDIRKVVDGTFGGRFAYFGNGKFKFIAYTD